jgi:hypothetical protein
MNPKGFVKLTEEHQIFLTKRFTMEELKKQLMGWQKNKSAGPKNWDLFKKDLFQMVEDLHENKLDVSRILWRDYAPPEREGRGQNLNV